jgi:hypothetical protein
MNSSLSPVRRLAVTIALAGFTAVGGITLAPAAMADDAAVVQPAPVTESAPVAESGPVTRSASVTEIQRTAATSSPVAHNRDGKPVKEPAMCSVQDMENQKKKIAKATEQVAPLIRAAEKLRAKAVELREQALTATRSVQSLNALADMADRAASQLEKQAAAHIQKAAELDCTPPAVVGGRF